MTGGGDGLHLVAHAGSQAFALPVASVIEVMRPLPARPLPDSPCWLSGLATIRGQPVPVIEVAALLGGQRLPATRFITVRAASRTVALACTAVEGVRFLRTDGLPPLARAAAADCIASVARADGELYAVLETARLLVGAALAEPTA